MGYTLEKSADRLRMVPGHLLEARYSLTSLGIPFLSEAVTGILNTDLMLIGAVSGVGKTQACLEIAKHCSMKKRRVLFIALEAEPEEIEMRLKYQLVSRLFFRSPGCVTRFPVNFRNWRLGLLDELIAFEEEARAIYADRYGYLSTVYRDTSFNFSDLEFLVSSTKGQFDMVVLDHLHYFDFASGQREDKNAQLSTLVRQIRDLNSFARIPFVVAAHVRKDFQGLMPGQEDFMGSSDIYKNATVIAMFGPKPDGYHAKDAVQETLITLPKIRTGGLGNLCGVVNFSLKHQGYDTRFKLGRLVSRREKFEELKREEWPDWAASPVTL